jgi:hypothetical protein
MIPVQADAFPKPAFNITMAASNSLTAGITIKEKGEQGRG